MRRRALSLFAVSLLLLAAALLWLAGAFGAVVTGFFAKNLCSSVFVTGRDPAAVVAQDLLIHWPRQLFEAVRWQVDRPAGEVRADLPLGLASARAVHRGGLGCAVLGRHEPQASAQLASEQSPQRQALQARVRVFDEAPADESWPDARASAQAQAPLTAPQRDRLGAALDAGFAEPPTDSGQGARRTRAILVVHRGRIVAERYAPGFDARSRFAGWSMAKSVTAAWLATLPASAAARPDDRIALKAWNAASAQSADPRAALTFRDALTMTSGLEFSEQYASPFSDVNRMLFVDGDTGSYAAARPLADARGTVFRYTSGTTNLISLALRERLGDDYALSPYRMLLDRIGMRSAVLEQDIAGTYVGSSYLLATARDWARFGLLFARDGVWNGERILPEGWVAFSRARSPAGERYGAHWWLGEPSEAGARSDDPLPADLFQATGYAGQRLSVVPSLDLVVVRLGLTLDGAALRHGELIRAVIAALR